MLQPIRFHRMIGLAVGKCPRCGAAVSYFARACPGCHAPNLPNPVAAAAALAAVLLAGGLIAFGWQSFRGEGTQPSSPQADAAPSGSPATPDYGWLVKAMAECDEEAKHRLDSLHFLIVPVIATGVPLPGWTPGTIANIGDAAALLHSSDTVIGLRNNALMLYPKPLTFVLSDPRTKTVYRWKPAVGVTALTMPQTGLGALMLGFEIPDVASGIEWGPTMNFEKGTCYWIYPLVLAADRSG
jgi:hypothetical protein